MAQENQVKSLDKQHSCTEVKNLDRIISEEEFDNMMSVERRLTKMINPDMIDIHPSEFDDPDGSSGISKYSMEDRIYAAIVFTLTGSGSKTHHITNIPIASITNWRKKDWFHKIADQVRKIRNDFMEAQLTQIAEEATKQMLDRLENGDEIYDARTSEKVRIKVKASDATTALKTALERREELRGRDVGGKERSSIVDHLKRLADAFEGISMGHNQKVIEAEVIEANAQ